MAKEKDPFAEFEDWLVDGPAGTWPSQREPQKELTSEQQTIVKNNAALLLDKDAWKKRVDAFEAAIQALSDDEEQKKTRATYHIRFDRFEFESGEKEFSGLYFPCSVSFAGAQFGEGNVYFINAQFGEGNVYFINAQFGEGNVNFREAQFGEGVVNFKEVQFGEGNVSFRDAQFGEGNVNFIKAQFGEGDVYFRDAQFGEGNVNFRDAQFGEGNVNFRDAQFGEGNVYFRDAQFGEGDVYFRDAQFGEGNVNFREAQFGEGNVYFRDAQFGEGNVNFIKAQFGEGNVYFIKAQFGEGNVYFIKAQFGEGDVYFREAQFGEGNVNFREAQFGEGNVNFREARFGEGNVNFIKAQFGEGDVYFREALFGEGDVYFNMAQFGEGVVNFREAQFGEGNVYFIKAQFGEGNVNFIKAQFGEGVVYLTDMKFSATSMFASDMLVCHLYVKAHFPMKADLQRLKVAESSSFSGCKFEQVPDFRDAKFDRPPDVANMDVPRPKLKKDRFWHFSRASDGQDAPRLRKLKAMALQANDHERDGYFFAREMRAKRGGETKSFSGLLFNTLYDWFSGYGQSFVKPFCWWGANLTSFCLYYVYIIGFAAEPWTRLYFAFHHSLRNSLPLLGGFVRYAIKPKDWQDRYGVIYKQLEVAKVDIAWLVNLGIIQSIIGGILLFLFLLALRNRFRLK